MQNLIQLVNSLTPAIIVLAIVFVVSSGPHISASKVDAWGFKADKIELTITRHASDKPDQTSKPATSKRKHRDRKHR